MGQGLVYSVDGSIFLNFEGEEKLIARRSEPVCGLELHNARLYDGGRAGIFDTIKGERILKRMTLDLCSHEERLYGCCCGQWNGEIFDALTGEVAVSRGSGDRFDDLPSTIMGREVKDEGFGGTKSLCSYNGRLIEVNEFGNIIDSFANKQLIGGHNKEIIGKCEDTLYCYNDQRRVIEEVYSGKELASRKYTVLKLREHEGRLYDASHSGKITETLNDKVIVKKNHWVTSLCSVNEKIAEDILSKVA